MAKFVPNVLTADVLRRLGIPTKKFNASFDDMMRVGKERILAFQRPDGGWGWFDGGAADPFMTACVVHGLSECERLGSKVDAVALGRGRERLRAIAREEKDLNRLALAAHALGGEFDRLLERSDELSSYAKALLVLTLHKAGRPEAAEIAAKLAAGVKGDHWETPDWHHKWDNVSIETTAYAIQALAAVDPSNPLIQKATRWLLAQRHGNRWRSTKDTAVAIATLLQVTSLDRLAGAVERDRREGDLPENRMNIALRLDGGRRRDLSIDLNNPTAGTFEAHFFDPGPGDHVLTFEKRRADFAFDIDIRHRVLGPAGAAAANGLGMTVEYDRPLAGLRMGDEVTATVTVRADETADYVMVLSPIPAGCEVIRGSGTGGFARLEARYEKAIFFIRTLGREPKRFEYRMRANFAGAYTVLPAWAGIMYNDEVHGTTGPRSASIAR